MDVLILCYRDEPLREFAVAGAAMEVGRAPGCDIVVHDPDVRDRHLLVQARSGSVLVHELGARRGEWRPLAPNDPLKIGRWHSLVRIPDAPTRPRTFSGATEPLAHDWLRGSGLSLIVGRGSEARRLSLEDAPVSIGSAPDNDLVLRDRAVSGRHCRLEPSERGWRLRDLGSRNGSFVDGVPVTLARIEPGSTIRIGRTDLRLCARNGKAHGDIVASSPAMRDTLVKVEKYAKLKWPILIGGESGTGKEGIARALHAMGPRASMPFVAINAGGMPRSLVESELFGHEKGAFTGASAEHRGVFEQAHGGTLFLDEIGELPLDLQARLLRVLESWEVRRVGAERAVKVDVRLVCASHRDLRAMVREGTLRKDLYHRIAILVIEVPPLRERPEDIEPLAECFLARDVEQLGPRRFSEPAIARLLAYDWPGNARELRNLVLRAAAGSPGTWISAEDVEQAFREAGCQAGDPTEAQLERVLEMHRGNLTAAARSLGLARSTLRDRLRIARERAKYRRGEE